MQDSAKYLIHADIHASGVVERSDVVGAIFGQTEGLLGEELDLRDLQESSKVGRIDVQIDSEAGRSYGTVTIASGLDRVETAVLAAGLETIDRIGPCRAEFEVAELEDARAAKRREVVERATELLSEFEETALSSQELVEAVRQSVRVADITEFEGLPAGPRVGESDAIVVVEGRADVLTLLQYGIKNAIAVEGTDVPEAVAALTRGRTVTAFLDGDRGGDLILKELEQVGEIDYVAVAPAGRSVEDLTQEAVLAALRKKVPYDHGEDGSVLPGAADTETPGEPVDADGGTVAGADAAATSEAVQSVDADPVDAPDRETVSSLAAEGGAETVDDPATGTDRDALADAEPDPDSAGAVTTGEGQATATAGERAVERDTAGSEPAGDAGSEPDTLAGHVAEVIGDGTGLVRLFEDGVTVLEQADADAAFEAIESAEQVPETVVLDGPVTQRLLDVAAQRGVGQVVGTSEGEFVKRPANVRVRTAAEF
jgi:DNA primase